MKKKPSLPSPKKCCGCSACYAICPRKAIAMQPDDEGFLQPVIDHQLCINCGKCEDVCPVEHTEKKRVPIATYAANAKNDTLRDGSSSGGVFTVLAIETIKNGGVVFGAGFEQKTWRIIHKAAQTIEQLEDLRGSKYVQSDTCDTYNEVRHLLVSGRRVLFSGCPCQVAALNRFLGEKYDNLLTVDLICHGVPTPLAWRKYLETREKKNQGAITKATTRRFCKWREFTLSFEFSSPDGRRSRYSSDRWHDSFMHSFVSFWSLRASCFHCRFRNLKSGADITLGDYNNVADINPEMDDDRGSSVVVVSTPNGKHTIEKIRNRLILQESALSHVIKANKSIIKNHELPRARKRFLKKIPSCEDFDELVSECSQVRTTSLFMHLAWWVKRLIVNREFNKLNWK